MIRRDKGLEGVVTSAKEMARGYGCPVVLVFTCIVGYIQERVVPMTISGVTTSY